ncbi:hypothetical protein [Thiomicrorhabdus sp. 6S3-12]|uniref:hypothetical protein n=1 Tax=Thiomicrorhabdus sp. 6S3-12 TaxID=2819681 RepID=UPI001AAD6515|nr:hypothetical protein [Thiomicrorhabdus sp. 6S3-12]MBO1923116.1 hypothetical protein [Thiomicrorhabdus sp. 6S3-12]
MQFSKVVIGAAVSAALLAGCESTQVKSEAPVAQEQKVAAPAVQEAAVTTQLFDVVHDGRYYSFYDFATYQSFLSVGETAYRLTRIGGGPHGETLVFGLAKADKKKGAETPAAMIWDGKSQVEGEFYGEMRKHGRIYVFSSKDDMDAVRQVGEPSYMYTQIGAGPKGETVVFVLNKSNKKEKPIALMAEYKTINGMK